MRNDYKINENMGWGEATARGILEGLIIREGTRREVECEKCHRCYYTRYSQSTCHRCGHVNYSYGPLQDTIIPAIKNWVKKKIGK